jgi:hypothetical protein
MRITGIPVKEILSKHSLRFYEHGYEEELELHSGSHVFIYVPEIVIVRLAQKANKVIKGYNNQRLIFKDPAFEVEPNIPMVGKKGIYITLATLPLIAFLLTLSGQLSVIVAIIIFSYIGAFLGTNVVIFNYLPVLLVALFLVTFNGGVAVVLGIGTAMHTVAPLLVVPTPSISPDGSITLTQTPTVTPIPSSTTILTSTTQPLVSQPTPVPVSAKVEAEWPYRMILNESSSVRASLVYRDDMDITPTLEDDSNVGRVAPLGPNPTFVSPGATPLKSG